MQLLLKLISFKIKIIFRKYYEKLLNILCFNIINIAKFEYIKM